MKYEIVGTGSSGNKEIWKPIEDFKDKYEVSNLGRIRNIITNHIYKFTNQYKDYFTIILYDKTHKRTTRVHREVAKAFIPNPNNFPCINHKDLNKQNNKVDNLEWCSISYNVKHGIKNGANTMSGFNNYNKNKFANKYGKIYQCDKNENVINTFKNLEEAYIKTGVCKRNILHCLNKQRKTAGKYIWHCSKGGGDNVL